MKKNYFSSFKKGLKGYVKAIKFISQNKLSYFYLFPLILNLFLFLIGIRIIDFFSDQINEYVINLSNYNFENLSLWRSFLNSVIYWTIWVVTKIVYIYIYAIVGGYFTIIILSPVFTLLSEKTAEIITGKKIKFQFKQLLKDTIRAVIIAIRNIIIQLFFSIFFLLTTLIPIIGWIISVIGNFLISSYFYGFSFIDYSNERNKLSVRESIAFIRNHKGFACGLGSLFSLCFFVPFVGGLIASLIAIVCVVNATIEVEEVRGKAKLIP